ncbi:MAG: thioredoxin domain-containing protein [Pyrinomonadaceae bacterium]
MSINEGQDAAPRHTNRLIHENSPYLQQHAHNPVDWYAWGPDALDRARRENKPIMLSIGYSACHWCHRLREESFENEQIARVMNEHFVNIKVDREERPDLDQIYMNAVQLLTGRGGWPLTVFLTPDLVPFFGGTYFPPEDRYNIPGFPRVLHGIAEAFRDQPDEVRRAADQMLAELRRPNASGASREALSVEMLDAAYRRIAGNYDAEFGGFGAAPKFPAAMNLEFLLRHDHRTNSPDAREMVERTCRMIAEGGMYDQLGGGFHRYSTDARWLVPHFEKMLYDNALLSRLYLHVYQLTRDPFYRRVAEETLDYVVREMTDPAGGFYSAQDADSEGVEGKFFVWTLEEVREVIGDESDADLFCAYYDVTREGNFEGQNILNVPRSAGEIAAQAEVSVERLMEAISRGKSLLFAARALRVKPGRDEKILTAWNGLMLASFAEAAVILDRADYLAVARSNADFTLTHLVRNDLFLRSYKDGQAKLNGYLDDYAYMVDGLLTLYEATGERRWAESALDFAERMVDEFWDPIEGGFFYTSNSHEQLIVRTKDYLDNATPAGNSVAAGVLLRLSVLTGREDYQRKAITIFRTLRDQLVRYSSAFGFLLGALDFYLAVPLEVAIVGDVTAADTRALAAEVWKRYLPNKVVAQTSGADEAEAELIPLLRARTMLGGAATAYVCEHFACHQPVTSPAELAGQLDE